MNHVYLVQRTTFSENTVLVEIRGAFEHMFMAARYARQLQDTEAGTVKITRHSVQRTNPARDARLPGTGWLPGGQERSDLSSVPADARP